LRLDDVNFFTSILQENDKMSESGIRRNVDKLGHVLEEVRERALLHLNTKLVHGLVTLEDLNKCPGFSRRLLGTFSGRISDVFHNNIRVVQLAKSTPKGAGT